MQIIELRSLEDFKNIPQDQLARCLMEVMFKLNKECELREYGVSPKLSFFWNAKTQTLEK